MKTLPTPKLPTTTQMTQAAQRMLAQGGSFDYHIASAYLHADSHNRELLTRTLTSRFMPFIPAD